MQPTALGGDPSYLIAMLVSITEGHRCPVGRMSFLIERFAGTVAPRLG